MFNICFTQSPQRKQSAQSWAKFLFAPKAIAAAQTSVGTALITKTQNPKLKTEIVSIEKKSPSPHTQTLGHIGSQKI